MINWSPSPLRAFLGSDYILAQDFTPSGLPPYLTAYYLIFSNIKALFNFGEIVVIIRIITKTHGFEKHIKTSTYKQTMKCLKFALIQCLGLEERKQTAQDWAGVSPRPERNIGQAEVLQAALFLWMKFYIIEKAASNKLRVVYTISTDGEIL